MEEHIMIGKKYTVRPPKCRSLMFFAHLLYSFTGRGVWNLEVSNLAYNVY